MTSPRRTASRFMMFRSDSFVLRGTARCDPDRLRAGQPRAIAALRALQVRHEDVAEEAVVQEIGMWPMYPRRRLGDEATHRIAWIPGVPVDIDQGDRPSITTQRRPTRD